MAAAELSRHLRDHVCGFRGSGKDVRKAAAHFSLIRCYNLFHSNQDRKQILYKVTLNQSQQILNQPYSKPNPNGRKP